MPQLQRAATEGAAAAAAAAGGGWLLNANVVNMEMDYSSIKSSTLAIGSDLKIALNRIVSVFSETAFVCSLAKTAIVRF